MMSECSEETGEISSYIDTQVERYLEFYKYCYSMSIECFHCYVIIIDYLLTLMCCTFQPMVALINHLLTYLGLRLYFVVYDVGTTLETSPFSILLPEAVREK